MKMLIVLISKVYANQVVIIKTIQIRLVIS